jgi:hypothetical protein
VLGAEDWAVDEPADAAGAGAGASRDGTVRRPVRTLDPGAERDVWRVEAGRGPGIGRGVFDLVFDWTDGSWRLTRCLD